MSKDILEFFSVRPFPFDRFQPRMKSSKTFIKFWKGGA